MKTTKASTSANTYSANTYKEYLEQREKELQEEVEFWHRAWKDTRAENAALKARVNELEASKEALEKDVERLAGAFRKAYWTCEVLKTDKKELEEEVFLLQVALKN